MQNNFCHQGVQAEVWTESEFHAGKLVGQIIAMCFQIIDNMHARRKKIRQHQNLPGTASDTGLPTFGNRR